MKWYLPSNKVEHFFLGLFGYCAQLLHTFKVEDTQLGLDSKFEHVEYCQYAHVLSLVYILMGKFYKPELKNKY